MSEGLPPGWEQTSLGELFDRLQYGYTAKAGPDLPGPRFLRITDIQAGGVDWRDVPGCQIDDSNLEKYRLRDGDIVFARSGSIEKAWRIRNAPQAVFASYLIRGRPIEPAIGAWLEAFIRSPSYLHQIGAAGAGIGMQNVNAKKLGSVSLPLPPKNEQRRIVAKIETLFERSRRAKEVLDAIPPLLDKLRQSILASAFRGDLTADWRAQNPDVEPADKLLARIRAERRDRWEKAELARMRAKGKEPKNDKWKAKYKGPAAGELDVLPVLPQNWHWITLGDVAWSVKDGPHYSPDYSDAGIPFLSGGNVRSEGLDFENTKFISEELHKELSRRCVPRLGDLLYTKGGTTGIARVNTYDCPFNVWVHVAVLRLVASIEPFFLQHMLNSPFCYRQSQKYTHGVGNQDLGLTRMVKILLPLPPLEEQREIVKQVDHCLRHVRHSTDLVARLAPEIERVDASVLAKAFRGELVDQDPNDEPASVLLERIRVAREAAKPAKNQQQRKQRTVATASRTAAAEKALPVPSTEKPTSARQPRLPFRLADYELEAISELVFAALWGQGALDKDSAVRAVAAALRDQGFCDFQRLRKDGALYAEILTAIGRAVKAGYLDRPRRNHVRAVRPSAADYGADDWRLALLATLGRDPTDRNEAIRAAAEWARDHLGLEFKRLRSDGYIARGLATAINSAIRRGLLERVNRNEIRLCAGRDSRK